MKSILSVLADIDRATPDGLLIELAALDATNITIRTAPRRGGHGHARVTWTQGHYNGSAEASTLAIALRRAVRAASDLSASLGAAS